MRLIHPFHPKTFVTLVVFGSITLLAPAAVAADHALKIQDDDTQAHEEPVHLSTNPVDRGNLAMVRREYVSAIAAFEQVDPKSPMVLNQLGVAYEHMGMYAKARTSFEESIKQDRKFATAYNNLGTVFYIQKNMKQAERMYKHAIKLDHKNASAFQNLGTVYFNRRKFNRGREAYEDAFRLDPEIFARSALFGLKADDDTKSLADISFFLAELYASSGKNDVALLYLIKALNNGFKDEARIRNDKELASLRETPGFITLMQDAKAPQQQQQKQN